MAKTPKRKLIGIEQQLLAAIQKSEHTLNAIATGSGVAYPQVHHFNSGARGIQLGTAAKLCEFLGLELTPKKRR